MKFSKLGMIGLIVSALSMNLASANGAKRSDIVDTAVQAGSFKTLLTAVKAAGLESTLRSKGPFTVFAPTDEAFAKLPAETLKSLLANPEALKAILLYHVVAGKVEAAQAIQLAGSATPEAKTVNGAFITLSLMKDSLYINNSKVIAADVEASNGVIHVIDTVLIPQAE